MRYPASEKLEIINLVEQSHLSASRTLKTLGVSRSTFYRWYDRLETGGPEALQDKSSAPQHAWNRIPDDVRNRVVELALDETALSPGNWRYASQTQKSTLSQSLPSTACSNSMT